MEKRTIVLDKYTRVVLTAITVLLTFIAVELADRGSPGLPAAQAQIPDTGKQRQVLLEETRQSNRLLSAILEHLRTKRIKVEVKETDTRKVGREAPRAKPRTDD